MARPAVTGPYAVRRHNLALLLEHVHRDGELSRAELTQRLGLNRSTVGALVAELAELRVVDEHVPTSAVRAGRPSHVVGPRPDGPYVIGVDVDVTELSAAGVGIGGRLVTERAVVPHPRGNAPEAVADNLVAAVEKIRADVAPGAWLVGLGVSVPGVVSWRTGTIVFAPNLRWRDVPFGALLAQRLPHELPIGLGNDADLAVLAEQLRGSARGIDDAIYLMGRIGLGAGIIANGRPLRGHDGHAGEVGHIVVDPSGPPCHCGKRGCAETYVGEATLLRLAGRRGRPNPRNVGAVLADAAAGDERAMAAVRAVGEGIGRVVATLVNMLNPQCVILGGSLGGVFALAQRDVERALHANAMLRGEGDLKLCPPKLGEDSPLLGAAELAFATLLSDPAGVAAARRGAAV
jgi:predicted NBD/HSP70 family sugar kinase